MREQLPCDQLRATPQSPVSELRSQKRRWDWAAANSSNRAVAAEDFYRPNHVQPTSVGTLIQKGSVPNFDICQQSSAAVSDKMLYGKRSRCKLSYQALQNSDIAFVFSDDTNRSSTRHSTHAFSKPRCRQYSPKLPEVARYFFRAS